MFPIFGSPEEIQKKMEEAAEHRHMHFQASVHEVKQLISDLSEEQLKTLNMIVVNSSQSEWAAAVVVGRIEGELQHRFDVCPCGDKHDTDDLLTHAPEPAKAEVKIDPESEAAMEMMYRGADGFDLASDEYLKSCETYGVRPINGGPKVECKSCGTVSVSLEDRMLRRPGVEGCSGCQQKSAWG
jgi:hypothetical protein